MTDQQTLLAEYAGNGSEAAFRDLVSRYINFVHSIAVRLVGEDRYLAEDVTQTVFIHLARNAHRLTGNVMLGGWLHRDTCNVAAKILRGQRRRQARERQAVEMNAQHDHSKANLEQISPILDEAINQLGEEDRTAIVLRFFEQLDFRMVGEALGSSEEAARKRVTRALEKLHSVLKLRGVAFSAAVLGAVLAEEAVSAAPAGLAFAISGQALSNVAASAGMASGFLRLTTLTNAKLGLVVALGMAGVATTLVLQHGSGLQGGQQAAKSGPPNAQIAEGRFMTNGNLVAAIVNGKPILESEVRERFGGIQTLLQSQYAAQPSVLRLKQREEWTKVVDSLINLELVVMDFDRRGLQLSEQEIETQMAGDNSDQRSNELRRRRIILAKRRLQELAQVPKPTQGEVHQYYEDHQKEFWQEDRVCLARISLKKTPTTDEGGVEFGAEAARKQATALRAKLSTGAGDGLTEMAKGTWYDVSELRPELAKAVSSLDVFDVSDVVETSNDFFILRVLDKEAARQKTLGEVTDQISKILLSKRWLAAEQHWYDGLLSNAVIRRFPLPPDF